MNDQVNVLLRHYLIKENEGEKTMKNGIIESAANIQPLIEKVASAYTVSAVDMLSLLSETGAPITEPVITAVMKAYAAGFDKGIRYERNQTRAKTSKK